MNPHPNPADRLLEVEIAALGGSGDGIAETPRGRVFVPFSAPGDRLQVRLEKGRGKSRAFRAAIVARLEDGPDRKAPECRHFGDCGGCALQHLTEAAYESWKAGRVREALSRQKLDPGVVAALRRIAPAARRRVGLKAELRGKGAVALGFFAAASHRIVDIAECPVMAPAICDLLPDLRRLFGEILAPGARAEAAVTLAETGLDVVLRLAHAPDMEALERLAGFAEDADLARLSWQALRPAGRDAPAPEPVAARRPVQAVFSGVPVDLPPDAFVQPSVDGERLLSATIAAALSGAGRVVDLYAGCGTFTFALAAAGAHVRAFEAADDHAAALAAAARRAGLDGQVTVARRDLVRRPLSAAELGDAEAVVLDPPRPGAAAQIGVLAGARVPLIAYVSCNPVSFARDARTLVDGGYRLESVMPVDQFQFSPHVELVALFRKGGGGPV